MPTVSAAGLKQPEFDLMVMLCREQIPHAPKVFVSDALSQPICWDRFLRMVKWHRVSGPVDRTLRFLNDSRIPVEVSQEIARLASAGADRAVKAMVRLAQIVREFERRNIPVCVLKGAPLSHQLFSNLGMRDNRDIDLMIPRSHLEQADRVLLQMGYPRTGYTRGKEITELSAYLKRSTDMEYRHAVTGQFVDLHWRLWNGDEWGAHTSQPSDWEPFSMNFVTVNVPKADFLLAYLCVHGAKHSWFRLKWLLDVACMLHADPDAADKLIAATASWNSTVPIIQGLLLSHHIFGTSLPSAMPPQRLQDRLALKLAMSVLVTDGIAETTRQQYLFTRHPLISRLLLGRRVSYFARGLMERLIAVSDRKDPSHRRRIRRVLFAVPNWIARAYRLAVPKKLAQPIAPESLLRPVKTPETTSPVQHTDR